MEFIVKLNVNQSFTKRIIADSEEEAIAEAKFILENRSLDAFNQETASPVSINAERV